MTRKLIKFRLGLLMFLQYGMLGVWFVPFGSYLSKGLGFDQIIGIAYGSQGIATIVSAFLVGMLADKFVQAQRLLAICFALSGATLLALAFASANENLVLILVFLHFLAFVPTIPLSNALCFRWLDKDSEQFPRLRAMGTIGWIVSGLVIGSIAGAAETRLPLLAGSVLALVLTFYALTLPATPPQVDVSADSAGGFLGLGVIIEKGPRDFWVLISITFLIMFPMAFYYAYGNNFLADTGAALTFGGFTLEQTAIQSLGQVSELLFLIILPSFLARFGVKAVIMLGLASWALRYIFFAFAFDGTTSIVWLLVLGVLLHGAANDFVQVAGQIFVNQCFDVSVRARAQAFLTTVLMGVGTIVGSVAANVIYVKYSVSADNHDWTSIWLIPAMFSILVLILFQVLFKSRVKIINPPMEGGH